METNCSCCLNSLLLSVSINHNYNPIIPIHFLSNFSHPQCCIPLNFAHACCSLFAYGTALHMYVGLNIRERNFAWDGAHALNNHVETSGRRFREYYNNKMGGLVYYSNNNIMTGRIIMNLTLVRRRPNLTLFLVVASAALFGSGEYEGECIHR